ncbi:hypothetical protein L1987_79064 [Smallanthus sonchifolius]|uniref:Uncharacterized protein n=1 Tax=Smallanthus sonchifolius TaxID=185202 RepID=A0ACB8ZIV9_9ASTR|nr:hypothetical protein L1987_79064 [Smallanthus sonchifolius]
MTADPSNAAVTRSDDGSGVNSRSGGITLPSPFSDSADRNIIFYDPAPAEGSYGGNVCNAGGVLKSAWNIPSANGVVEGFTSPVMGAAAWPALSESTRSGIKLSSVNSESSSQAPVISQPPQQHVKPNSNHVRQQTMRRGGSAGGASAGYNRPQAPPSLPPPFPILDMFGNLVPTVSEFPQPSFKNNNWSPRSVDQTSSRNPARRNNFDPRPVNHGPRSPAARDAYIPNQMGRQPVRGFVPPPFIPHQPLRPYVAHMGYDMGASYVYIPTLAQEVYRGGAPLLPHGASGSSMYIPYLDPSLLGLILRQIEYYFSDENLVKDMFLRSYMDDGGWVPITLIAGFQRVQKLTNDMQMILSSLTYSNTVEIQGDKVRRRTDWRKWIHIPRETSVQYASSQKLTLEDRPTNEKEVLVNGDDR